MQKTLGIQMVNQESQTNQSNCEIAQQGSKHPGKRRCLSDECPNNRP